MVATLEQVFRKEWGRVLATLIGAGGVRDGRAAALVEPARCANQARKRGSDHPGGDLVCGRTDGWPELAYQFAHRGGRPGNRHVDGCHDLA